MAPAPAWRTRPDGLEIRVRVTPRGGADEVEGVETLADGRGVLKVRVRSAPDGGAANEALRRLIAKALGRPASAVSIEAGAAMRVKSVLVSGDAEAIAGTLMRLVGDRG